ncbi:MAG: hypothetical protein ACKOKF_02690 [Bacteroidota bacterium]
MLKRICLILLVLNSAFVERAFAQDPSFSVYIDNPNYVSSNVYEFDIMVKAMGATTTFQLRTFQAGIYVDSAWVGSSAIAVSAVAGSSQLTSPAYNGSFSWNASDKLINCSVNTGVRTVSASCVSTSIGTAPRKIARVRLTNPSGFTCIPPNLKFNYVQNASPLRLRTSVSWRATGCTSNFDMFYPNRPFSGSAYFNGELYSTADVDGRSPSSTIANNLPCTVPYSLTVLIEGYYLGAGEMQPVMLNQGVNGATATQTDTVTIELRTVADPSIVVSSVKSVISITGNTSITFPSGTSGNSYWLVVRHRNSIETWSANPVVISAGGNYNFSNLASNAYGGNMAMVEAGVYAMYSGDFNSDGFVDSFDSPPYELSVLSFATGYLAADLNGDGFVDTFDSPVFEKNNLSFIMLMTP